MFCIATGSQCKHTAKCKNRTWLYSYVCHTFTLTSDHNAKYSEPGLTAKCISSIVALNIFGLSTSKTLSTLAKSNFYGSQFLIWSN